MKKCLFVFLHDVFTGNLYFENGRLSFVYDSVYLKTPEARAISSSMPLGDEVYPHLIVSPFFSGLLPDEGVRYRLAKYLHLSDKNIFSLLEAIGGECAGAISVKTTKEIQDNTENYLILNDDEALEVMHSLQQRPFLVGEQDIRISAAGAQCKLMIAFVDGKLAIPKGHTPSTHIIKPNIPGYEDTVFNEFFCMTLAQKIGLLTPKVQVLHLKDQIFYTVERYDRVLKNNKIYRLHQEDFCQLLNIPPEIKYENEGGPNLKECFELIDSFMQKGQMPGMDKLRLLKLVMFNYLIGNTDAHGKNFSVLYQEHGMTLAPCYDLLSTMAYSNHYKNKMAMKIGGEYDNQFIHKKHWVQLAQDIGFKEVFLLQQLKKTAELVYKEAASLKNTFTDSYIYSKIWNVIEYQYVKVKNL
jgi:serine/threonine-protein kinase HipA